MAVRDAPGICTRSRPSRRAGYRVITFDNRGVGATENADGFTTETMVDDTAALIESLDAAPVRIVGGVDGLLHRSRADGGRPDLVSRRRVDGDPGPARPCARLLSDRRAQDCRRPGFELPPTYDAKIRLLENFSPKTLNNDKVVADWIGMFNDVADQDHPGLIAHKARSRRRTTGCPLTEALLRRRW